MHPYVIVEWANIMIPSLNPVRLALFSVRLVMPMAVSLAMQTEYQAYLAPVYAPWMEFLIRVLLTVVLVTHRSCRRLYLILWITSSSSLICLWSLLSVILGPPFRHVKIHFRPKYTT